MKSFARLIESPPRSSPSGVGIIFVNILLLSIVSFSLNVSPWAAGTSILLLAAAVLSRKAQALHISIFIAALTILPFLFPSLRSWPFNLLIPLALYLAATLMLPTLRKSLLWMRPGRFDKDIMVMVIATTALSGLALYLWHRALNLDLSLHLGYMPHMPLWVYPLAGLGFAIGNATLEEFVFRGVVMQALDSAVGPGKASIIVQAWLFGAMHYLQGFPNGVWGLAMTVVYGIMLGAIRRRGQGMLAPWVAHVCADLVIFAILAAIILEKQG